MLYVSTRLRIWSWISMTVFGSMPANGSSSMMSFGSVMSERAISRRRRSPPETRLAFVFRILARPNWSSSSSWRSRRCFRESGRVWRIAMRLSSTVSCLKTLESWAR
jgi:hypothetical protein